MSALWRDLAYAVRTLLHSRRFTLAAVFALALGIGANTAIFTVVRSVLLRPLPYPQAERIVAPIRPNGGAVISYQKFDFVRRNNHVFSEYAAHDVLGSGFNLTEGEPERLKGMRVTEGFFPVLGVNPALGRGFTAEEDTPGGPRAVVISYAVWQGRYGGSRSILNSTLNLNGEPYTVVGVMPRDFRYSPEAEIWLPMQLVIRADVQGNMIVTIGRLKNGVARVQADADLARLSSIYKAQLAGRRDADERLSLIALHDLFVGDVRQPLLVLLGAVAFVLLIACANVANLLLARAASRTREVAIRLALGASRAQLVRQFLTESVLLALAGGLLGVALGAWGLRALLAFQPTHVGVMEIGFDRTVLLFTLGVSVLTGLLFGLAPALHCSRPNMNETLKSEATAVAGSRGRMRGALVVAETALALLLLCGAGLLIQTFLRLRAVELGFDPHNVVTMQMSLGGKRYESRDGVDAFYRDALRRLEAVPGVESAGTVTSLPLERGTDFPYDVEGRTDANFSAQWRHATWGYFRAMRIPLRRGRYFSEQDTASSTPVVIVNEAFARQTWPDYPRTDAVGRRVTIGRALGPQFGDPVRVVVGVIGDVHERGAGEAAPPAMFVPASQVPSTVLSVLNRLLPTNWVVRVHGDPTGMVPAIRNALRQADASQPVSNVRSMDQVFSESVARQNFNMLLLSTFAAVALLLAATGIYAVMSFSVSQRTREIGLRVALGATTNNVGALIVGEGMRLALLGITLGLAGSLAVVRLLSGMLYGVKPADPLNLALAGLLLFMVALAANAVPAWRATRVDPMTALRCE